jgi:thiol-disulfide isomerase/thioredoxin
VSRLAAAAVLALATSAVTAAPAPDSIPVVTPLVAFDPAGGQAVPLDPAQGPMHLVFLATWCRPCIEQIPRLFDLEDRYKAEGYRLILVAVPTRQTEDRLRTFLAGEPVPGRLLFDREGLVEAVLGVKTLPQNVLIDREGRVVARSGVPDAAFAEAVDRLVRLEGRANP